jgi:cutinase
MRRLLVASAATMISGTALIAPVAAPTEAVSISLAQADPCPSVQVVFARGTDEPEGVGRVGEAFVDSLRSQTNVHSVAVYAVDYPASREFLRAVEGANDASLAIQNTAAACPNTNIVLGGYS